MATWADHGFRHLKDAIAFLNGAIIVPANLGKGLDLDGKTLIISKDGGVDRTVTFTAKGSLWSAKEIVDQIVAAHADLVGAVTYMSGVGTVQRVPWQFLVIGKDDGSVYTIKGTGTANSLFGLPATNVVGTPFTNTEAQLVKNIGDQHPWVVVTYK